MKKWLAEMMIVIIDNTMTCGYHFVGIINKCTWCFDFLKHDLLINDSDDDKSCDRVFYKVTKKCSYKQKKYLTEFYDNAKHMSYFQFLKQDFVIN